MGFNGAVFERLLPLAHAHNLRIVSLNRRGYSPSSGFRDDELTTVGFGKKIDEAEPFFRAQGLEIATFLVNFATEQGIPLADPKGPQGGIALIGWSLGGIHVLALLAHIDEFPEETKSTLHKYLHTILSHDANSVALGIPSSVKHNIDLWFEPDDQKRLDAFFEWATAHYVHKSVTSENIDDLEFNNPSSDIPRSMHDISYEERAKYLDVAAFGFGGCDGKLLFCDVSAFAVLTKRALLDKARAEKYPHVRVVFMSSGASAGTLVSTIWLLRKHLEDPPEALFGSHAEKARDVKFVQAEGNHFIFWDDPEKAIQQFTAAINS